MTRIEELEQKLNECQKALAEIQKEIIELNELQIELKESKKEGKWKPAIGEDFWHRDESGLIACCHFTEYNQYNRWMADNIPLFKTKEACERYWHFMDTVKEKSYEFSKEEWEDINIRKYYIFYSYNNTYFKVHSGLHCKELGKIYFKDEESAQYIIDNFKDELMEYFV